MSKRPLLVLASGNAGKAREFARLLGELFTVRPLPSGVPLPQETGCTFAENARLKAEAVFRALGGRYAVLADDSGLEVSALGGRPGLHSARYAGESATDAQNVAKLLQELAGVTDRRARFVCCLCLVLPAGAGWEVESGGGHRIIEVEGTAPGSITETPRGQDGFGYDPVFQPEGWTRTLAEASPADKDRVSHRGAAARLLLERLRSQGW
jgi:XTP/dITP diphosphohydrolase